MRTRTRTILRDLRTGEGARVPLSAGFGTFTKSPTLVPRSWPQVGRSVGSESRSNGRNRRNDLKNRHVQAEKVGRSVGYSARTAEQGSATW